MNRKISKKRECFSWYGMIKVNGRRKSTKCKCEAVFETVDDAIPFCRLHARRLIGVHLRELSKSV